MTAMTSSNLSGKHTGGKRPLQVDASGDTHVKIYFEKHFHLPFIKCTRDKNLQNVVFYVPQKKVNHEGE